MNVLVEVKRSLTLLDLVFHAWARELGIDDCSVTLILLLAEEGDLSAAELAVRCGRARQQVRRSLLQLEAQGRVEVSHLAVDGRVEGWSLTEPGMATAHCLDQGVAVWSKELGTQIDLVALSATLAQVVRFALNARTSNGWARRLYVPRDLRAVTMRNRAEFAGIARPRAPPRDPRAPAPEVETNDGFTEEDHARIAAAWRALWD